MQRIITSPSVGAAGATQFILGDDTTALPIVTAAWASGLGGPIVDTGFLARQKRKIQIQDLFRQGYPFITARFNWLNSFEFTVHRVFSAVQNCLAFVAFHPDSVPAGGEVTLSHTSASGVVHRYLPNAVVDSPECIDQTGVRCRFKYRISAPNPWQTTA
jgi:hypothetical protein